MRFTRTLERPHIELSKNEIKWMNWKALERKFNLTKYTVNIMHLPSCFSEPSFTTEEKKH